MQFDPWARHAGSSPTWSVISTSPVFLQGAERAGPCRRRQPSPRRRYLNRFCCRPREEPIRRPRQSSSNPHAREAWSRLATASAAPRWVAPRTAARGQSKGRGQCRTYDVPPRKILCRPKRKNSARRETGTAGGARVSPSSGGARLRATPGAGHPMRLRQTAGMSAGGPRRRTRPLGTLDSGAVSCAPMRSRGNAAHRRWGVVAGQQSRGRPPGGDHHAVEQVLLDEENGEGEPPRRTTWGEQPCREHRGRAEHPQTLPRRLRGRGPAVTGPRRRRPSAPVPPAEHGVEHDLARRDRHCRARKRQPATHEQERAQHGSQDERRHEADHPGRRAPSGDMCHRTDPLTAVAVTNDGPQQSQRGGGS